MNASARTPATTPADVVGFWRDAGYDKWFGKDEAFDQAIRDRFLETHETAARGELEAWRQTREGSLALLILLDQFPRNMFRGDRRTYATDALALAVAEDAVAKGFDRAPDDGCRLFFYLPFMHAEDLSSLDRAVQLYEAAGDESSLQYARHHRDIIARFGRFPHRNAILGRETTAEEQAFLDGGGFKG